MIEHCRRIVGACAWGLALLLTAGCAEGQTFAQYPGFAEWFAEHPPDPRPPTAAERELLRQYRPVLRTTPAHPGPLDFYRDYIAHGTLRAGDRDWNDVHRKLLERHVDDPDAVFHHRPPTDARNRRVAYGRVDRAALEPFGELTFLTWHFVFRHSGLPSELPAWQGVLAGLLGDRDDWHQLDHYTAATLVLGPRRQPLGLLLQQHNVVRSYWFGRDLALPADGRVRLAAAVRSNELYPWTGERRRHRVVRFLAPDNLRWLASGAGEAPWTAAHDIVQAGRPIDYALRFLPQTDPFYRFHGRLGARRLLPGRDGPPGADYNALPAFKDRVLQFCALRWSGRADTERLDALEALLADPDDETARARLFRDCRAFVRTRLTQ